MRLLICLCLFAALNVQSAYADTLKRGFAWPIIVGELDPHNTSSDTLFALISHYLEPLLRMAPDGTLLPGVAERWTISENGETVTLYLNKQARWASGVPITTAQVKQSIERALSASANSDAQSLLLPIKGAKERLEGNVDYPLGIQVLAEHEIRFQLTSINPDFLKVLAFPISSPVPVHQIGVDNKYPPLDQLDSSGPYRLVCREKYEVCFERNKHHFQKALVPHYSEVSFKFAEYQALIEDFLKQSLDVVEFIPAQKIPWLETNMPEKLVLSADNIAVYLVAKSDVMGGIDAELRKLMMGSVDRNRLGQIMTKGMSSPASGIIPWETGKSLAGKSSLPDARHYLEEGRLLTEKLGYSADNPLVLCAELRHSATNEIAMSYLRAVLRAMHVQLKYKYVLQASNYVGECPFVFEGFASRIRSTEEVLLAFVTKGGLFSEWLADDPELKQLTEKFFGSQTLSGRKEILNHLEKNLTDRHLVKALYRTGLVSLVHSDKVANYSQAKTNMFIPLSEYLRP